VATQAQGLKPPARLAFRPFATARLRLRPITHADDDAFLRVFSDPETMRYWSREPLADLDEARRMVQEEIDWGRSGQCVNWGLAKPDDDRLIGKLNLFRYDAAHRRAEIGYALERRYWGRGLMTEALAPVLGWAFGELGLHRLEADADPDNRASLALLENYGFRPEGLARERYRLREAWRDSVLLGLLAADYRAAVR